MKPPHVFTFVTAALLLSISSMRAESSPAERVAEIQKALQAAKLDGWLFYDFRGSDPLALRILKLDENAVGPAGGFSTFRPRVNAPRSFTASRRRSSTRYPVNARNTAVGKNNMPLCGQR